MNIVVAVDSEWGIGLKDQLIVRISEDMKRFRALTIGKIVVLGRKTLETFPEGRPLEQRINIIMTRHDDFAVGSALICHSLGELAKLLQDLPDENIYVIGGASIYDLLLPYCRYAYVTRIEYTGQADRYFPNLDEDQAWELVDPGQFLTSKGTINATGEKAELAYRFCLYEQKQPRPLTTEDFRKGLTNNAAADFQE
jgi:dihydrofolate reductase